MIVLTPEEMGNMDRETIKDGYPELLLMEMAGRGTVEIIEKEFSETITKVTIFCGKGNNGGDGFTAARFLDMWGYDVRIIYTGKSAEELSEVSLANYNICELRKIPIESVTNLTKDEVKKAINDSGLIIDALLGTGLKGEVRGVYSWIIDLIIS